mmetsp:Transcript_48101/g.125083  ORF Transcript_48101/g.125083 Transcript_48101/m.125083 type:complete len:784 (-) Transcript_48101:964-3315(-)
METEEGDTERAFVIAQLNSYRVKAEELGKEKASLREEVNHLSSELRFCKDTNEELQRNFETLREAHQRAVKEVEVYKKGIEAVKEDKKRVERGMEAKVQKWKLEVEAKMEEMEQLRTSLISPEEFQRIRLQMLQEMEEPHRQNIIAMEEQVNHYRDACIGLRRDLELLKVQYDEEKRKAALRVEELENSSLLTISSLQERVRQAEKRVRDNDMTAEVAELQQVVEELKQKNKYLEEDNAAMLDENAAVVSQREAIARQAIEKQEDMEAEHQRLLGEVGSAKGKIEHLTKRVDEGARDRQRLEAELEKMVAKLKEAKSKAEEREVEVKALQVEIDHIKTRKEYEYDMQMKNALGDLHSSIDRMRSEREEEREENERERSLLEAKYTAKLDEVRTALSQMEVEKERIKEERDDALRDVERHEYFITQQKSREEEREREVEKEKGALLDQIDIMEQTMEELKGDYARKAEEASVLKEKLSDAEVEVRKWKDEASSLSEELGQYRSTAATVKEEKDRLEAELTSAMERGEKDKQDTQKEIKAILTKWGEYKSTIMQSERSARTMLKAEKKKKEKLSKAYETLKNSSRSLLQSLQNERDTLQHTLRTVERKSQTKLAMSTAEVEGLRQRLREMQRMTAEFQRAALSDVGTNGGGGVGGPTYASTISYPPHLTTLSHPHTRVGRGGGGGEEEGYIGNAATFAAHPTSTSALAYSFREGYVPTFDPPPTSATAFAEKEGEEWDRVRREGREERRREEGGEGRDPHQQRVLQTCTRPTRTVPMRGCMHKWG